MTTIERLTGVVVTATLAQVMPAVFVVLALLSNSCPATARRLGVYLSPADVERCSGELAVNCRWWRWVNAKAEADVRRFRGE